MQARLRKLKVCDAAPELCFLVLEPCDVGPEANISAVARSPLGDQNPASVSEVVLYALVAAAGDEPDL